jgi:hypothetical protein
MLAENVNSLLPLITILDVLTQIVGGNRQDDWIIGRL